MISKNILIIACI